MACNAFVFVKMQIDPGGTDIPRGLGAWAARVGNAMQAHVLLAENISLVGRARAAPHSKPEIRVLDFARFAVQVVVKRRSLDDIAIAHDKAVTTNPHLPVGALIVNI